MNQSDFDLAVKFVLRNIIQTETWNLSPTNIETYHQLVGDKQSRLEKLTPDKAIDVYKLLYWDLAGCNTMPRRLAIAHFDSCIDQGVGKGIRMLQECLGEIRRDGGFGVVTDSRLKEYLHNYGEDTLLKHILAKRRSDYLNISDRSLSQSGIDHLHQLASYLETLSQPEGDRHPLMLDLEKLESSTPIQLDDEEGYDSVDFDNYTYSLSISETSAFSREDSDFDGIDWD